MPGNNIILGHRVGISNFRPSAMKNMDMYDSYWRENIAREGARLRSEVNSELNFCPNFEGLVLGCIDADFCK